MSTDRHLWKIFLCFPVFNTIFYKGNQKRKGRIKYEIFITSSYSLSSKANLKPNPIAHIQLTFLHKQPVYFTISYRFILQNEGKQRCENSECSANNDYKVCQQKQYQYLYIIKSSWAVTSQTLEKRGDLCLQDKNVVCKVR